MVYQALIRTAADVAASRPGLDMDRISFTILLETAGDLVATASAVWPAEHVTLIDPIGRAVLRGLLPAWRRPRVRARSRKNPTSKYGPNAGPATTQTYTFHAQVTVMEDGLAPRPRR
ncbi:hypothetical protein ACGFNP_15595 [Nonomuraea sp. NPDC049269]|uniref:hypothetical protein n=1 Tax=Nonomuraea sp. NPDC049269 TaxID=3364349 RepID=UPI003722B3EC